MMSVPKEVSSQEMETVPVPVTVIYVGADGSDSAIIVKVRGVENAETPL